MCQFATEYGMSYVEISSKTGENVEKIFEIIQKHPNFKNALYRSKSIVDLQAGARLRASLAWITGPTSLFPVEHTARLQCRRAPA